MPSLLRKQNVIWKLSVAVYAAALFAISSSAWSTSFTIADGETETSAQTLATGETGTINSGGKLTTSAHAITASSVSNITVLNNGAITTTGGSHRYGVRSLSNSGTNTFTLSLIHI